MESRISRFRMFSLRSTMFCLLVGLGGCSFYEGKKAAPTAFLVHHEKLQEFPERSPFNLGWNIRRERPEYAGKLFEKVYLKPVNLDYFGQGSVEEWRQKVQIMAATNQEVRKIADYMYEKFLGALVASSHKFETADAPDANVLVVEVALIELDPTQVPYKLAGAAAGSFIPGGSAIKMLGTGTIGMEMKFSDGVTGEVLGEVADRREDKAAILADFNNFSRLGHAKDAIDDWAAELKELFSTPITHKVDRARSFVLIGW